MTPANRQTRRLITKQLGSLWVVGGLLRRLGVAEIIDRACPIREVAPLTHGQVITALVANRLSAPEPLQFVQDWAEHWAVEEVLGTPAHFLNDDRLGRALDAIFPHLEGIQGSVAWSTIEGFNIDTSIVHWDFTSFSFTGSYEEQHEAGPTVTWGHSKAKRPDLKQIMMGLGVTADGGIPVHQVTEGGSTAEVSQVVSAMEALKRNIRRQDFILVGDTKLISKTNVLAACREGVRFCAPAPASDELREAFSAIPRTEFRRLAYHSGREDRKAPEDRTTYLGTERTWTLTDPKTKQTHTVRRIFVISSEELEACQKNRSRQMEKAEVVLRKVQANLGLRWYDTAEKVRDKVTETLKKCRVTAFYKTEIGEETGKPTFTWSRDEEALAAAAALDGFYVIVTNLPDQAYDTDAILNLYKGQYRVERRFADFKGPLAVSPMFLKDNRRIASLVFVIYLALLIYCLIEREVRKGLADQGGKLRGLVPGGTAVIPTTYNILRVFKWLTVNVTEGVKQPLIEPPNLQPIQQRLHRLLGIPDPFSS